MASRWEKTNIGTWYSYGTAARVAVLQRREENGTIVNPFRTAVTFWGQLT